MIEHKILSDRIIDWSINLCFVIGQESEWMEVICTFFSILDTVRIEEREEMLATVGSQ